MHYINLKMVYAEVLLGKRVQQTTMIANYHSHIIKDTIDISKKYQLEQGTHAPCHCRQATLTTNGSTNSSFFDHA
jgi:hypothetical protein